MQEATLKAQFIKKLSGSENGLKKSVAYNKKCVNRETLSSVANQSKSTDWFLYDGNIGR